MMLLLSRLATCNLTCLMFLSQVNVHVLIHQALTVIKEGCKVGGCQPSSSRSCCLQMLFCEGTGVDWRDRPAILYHLLQSRLME